jgi:hypothetical protein
VSTSTGPLNGANWSDYYGHFGMGDCAAGFTSALSNVTDIGLSFVARAASRDPRGGLRRSRCGYFFENGVGAPNGATFSLTGFTVS